MKWVYISHRYMKIENKDKDLHKKFQMLIIMSQYLKF